MRRLSILLACLALISACHSSRSTPISVYHAQDYQQHKNTLWIKLHWNYRRPDAGTVIAEGFVEPFNQRNGVHNVILELVGLDDSGHVVSAASGRPADLYIVSPYDTSRFRIVLKLTGAEKDFTIRGSYYFYNAGNRPDFDSRSLDYIPLVSDEPY